MNPDLRVSKRTKCPIQDSVFVSQYEREEEAAKKILEQHVNLTDTSAQKFQREKDGKKICWNFRKGRCYKGLRFYICTDAMCSNRYRIDSIL